MAEVTGIGTWFLEVYNAFTATLPPWAQQFITLFFLAVLIAFYAWFIWKFYRFIATKNILHLNLNKYNTSEHPFFTKLLAGIFFLLEYIIILPFLIFFWFGVFTLFLILLTENIVLSNLLIISASVIAAIRLTSYVPRYGQELAKEIAKLLPFTLLAVSILNSNFFSVERILTHFNQLPNFFNQIMIYLVFIIFLEIVLRFFDFVFSLFGLEESDESEED